eukprot:2106352-Amphidinium_carterae.1
MNFSTGYIKEGNVIMHWPSIASQYLRRGFVVDFLALLMELLACTQQYPIFAATLAIGCDDLQWFKHNQCM